MAVQGHFVRLQSVPEVESQQNYGQISNQQSKLLSKYIELYSDPNSKEVLVSFLQAYASELPRSAFYDAAIVYAAADRNLALDIKGKLSDLILENNDHPRICLYDDEEFVSPDGKLPNVLIDRCALILLLLTENFENDKKVQFVNQQVIENTRFCKDIPHWQFYCVRPLHTQPRAERSYDVPSGMTSIRSYEVYDFENHHEREKLEGLFNCYSWFRKNHEIRCCANNSEVFERHTDHAILTSKEAFNVVHFNKSLLECHGNLKNKGHTAPAQTTSDVNGQENHVPAVRFDDEGVFRNHVTNNCETVEDDDQQKQVLNGDCTPLINGLLQENNTLLTHKQYDIHKLHDKRWKEKPKVNNLRTSQVDVFSECKNQTSDLKTESQTSQNLQLSKSTQMKVSFFDAAIVYADVDKHLALDIKCSLSSLNLENGEHPKICLYDDQELARSNIQLPNVLINRCALILLLLTENFEDDEKVQFINQHVIENTRFCKEMPHWQFYCVRPLHTQPRGERLYNVPSGMTSIRSYEVHDLDTQVKREKMERVFSSYSWFRESQEGRAHQHDETSSSGSLMHGLLTEAARLEQKLPYDEEIALSGNQEHQLLSQELNTNLTTEQQLQNVIPGDSTQLDAAAFYDAVIVYAGPDRNLALDIKQNLSDLKLKDNEHPKICLYDDKEFTRSDVKLPDILIERCALIFLLLTENVDDDDKIKFMNIQTIKTTRFSDTTRDWQFYCVRPIHTQPTENRSYNVPTRLTANRSYELFHLETSKQKEVLQDVFNTYSWFRMKCERLVATRTLSTNKTFCQGWIHQISEEKSGDIREKEDQNDGVKSQQKHTAFIQSMAPRISKDEFYDAVIVYAAADRNLALDIRQKLSSLTLNDNGHPTICLYDDEELQTADGELPNILINRCALILLLLTENFEDDNRVLFVKQQIVTNTRFGERFPLWQFYCVRPLHTQPIVGRTYDIPFGMSSLRSYDVYDVRTDQQREALEDLFECYSWFRKSQYRRVVLQDSAMVSSQTSNLFSQASGLEREPVEESMLKQSEGQTCISKQQEDLLLQYFQVCYKPASEQQLIDFLQTNAAQLPKVSFFDAAIIYADADRSLALDIKCKLSSLNLENGEHPKICLYDDQEFTRSNVQLPNVLINRCALILLLLTENFENDEKVQFVNESVPENTRFCKFKLDWQFYCVRLLHTQGMQDRSYNIPTGMESNRSYGVWDLEKTERKEELESVFNCYLWFRRNHEARLNNLSNPEGVIEEDFVEEDIREEETFDKKLLSEYIRLCYDPKTTDDLKQYLRLYSSKLPVSAFYDAAIVYAAADRNLALDIKGKLSDLTLENNDHPRICLYDDEEFVPPDGKLPNVLIDCCALILLLLTENFENDEKVQFVNQQVIESSRFSPDIPQWQFYCVRPLHTQPKAERSYDIPPGMKSISSYDVYNIETQHNREKLENLFNCYSWFKRNHIKRCLCKEDEMLIEMVQPLDEEIGTSNDTEIHDVITELLAGSSEEHNPDSRKHESRKLGVVERQRGDMGCYTVQGFEKSQHELDSNATISDIYTEVQATEVRKGVFRAPASLPVKTDFCQDAHQEQDNNSNPLTQDEFRSEEIAVTTRLSWVGSSPAAEPSDGEKDTIEERTILTKNLLTEYIKLYSDPKATKQLVKFLQTNASKLPVSAFYDAVIVYAAADKKLALNVRNILANLTLENNEHPKICLYDELKGIDVKLPNVLIDRCALILLLLTDNFEEDENVQFVNDQAIANTRFYADIANWQDYCIRPLHTQPKSERTYSVPVALAPIHSYDVYNLSTQSAREKLEGLFNCYSWFRKNHENRCRVSEERHRKRSDLTHDSDLSMSPVQSSSPDGNLISQTSASVQGENELPVSPHGFISLRHSVQATVSSTELDPFTPGTDTVTPGTNTVTNEQDMTSTKPNQAETQDPDYRISKSDLASTKVSGSRPVSQDDVFDASGDVKAEEMLKLLQGLNEDEAVTQADITVDPEELLNQDVERDDQRSFCCGCLAFFRWGRKSRKREGVSFMELVDHD